MKHCASINGKSIFRVDSETRAAVNEGSDSALVDAIEEATDARVTRLSPEGRTPGPKQPPRGLGALSGGSIALIGGGMVAVAAFGGGTPALIVAVVYSLAILGLSVPVVIAEFARFADRIEARQDVEHAAAVVIEPWPQRRR